MSDINQRLKETPRRKRNLDPRAFDWNVNQNGVRSRVARLRADVAHKILGRASGESLELALPAYESFTTDGSAGDQESFALSHGVIESPNTDPVVVWLDGDYYGSPDNDNYASTGSISVTDSGTNSTVHVFYIPNKAGTVEIEKAVDGSTSKSQNLKTVSVKNIHRKNLSEEGVYFEFNGPRTFESFIAGDMTLDVYADVPYIVRYEDPDGDGSTATNALLNFSTLQAQDTVSGFKAAVTDEM